LLDSSQQTWKVHKFLNSSKLVAFFVYLTDPTDNAVAVSESDGDAYSQEAHDEIDANETDSDVTCRSASTEKSDDETPDEHPVNISFSDLEEPVRRSGRQVTLVSVFSLRFWNWFYWSFSDISNW
jgi:hypothetical protein